MSRAHLLLILLTNQTSSCPSLPAVMWIPNLTLSMMLLEARWTCMLPSEQPEFAITLVHLYQEALNNSWIQETYFTAIFFSLATPRKLAIKLSVKTFKTRTVHFVFSLRIFVSVHVIITSITAPGMFIKLCLVVLLLLPGSLVSKFHFQLTKKS